VIVERAGLGEWAGCLGPVKQGEGSGSDIRGDGLGLLAPIGGTPRGGRGGCPAQLRSRRSEPQLTAVGVR
jgi:hypothetical protein